MSTWMLGTARSEARDLHREESGQVTFFFVFASIALVFLLALVLNTSQQTARKVQMQGAADAGAMAGGVWMARGMNLMAFNNKGMADILSLMIDVHAVDQTSKAMGLIMFAAGTAAAASIIASWMAPHFFDESAFWFETASVMGEIEDVLDPVGWDIMYVLDELNQVVKVTLPFLTEFQVVKYARTNGAEQAYLFAGSGLPIPKFPVGRGGKEFIADQADRCCLQLLKRPTEGAVLLACEIATLVCESALIAWPIYEFGAIPMNVNSLGGHPYSNSGTASPDSIRNKVTKSDGTTIDDQIDAMNKAGAGDPNYQMKSFSLPNVAYRLLGALTWPENPPYPMILTDRPSFAPDAMVDSSAPVNLTVVRRMLEYLALTHAARPSYGIIGGDRFENPGSMGWITFGQADVYNPTGWGMFNQNWRVKLGRATLLPRAVGELDFFGAIPILSLQTQFDFLTTH